MIEEYIYYTILYNRNYREKNIPPTILSLNPSRKRRSVQAVNHGGGNRNSMKNRL